MRKKTEAFVRRAFGGIGDNPISLTPEFRHCIGNRIVEASIESLEFVIGDQRVAFDRELRNGLAEIPVVMDDLVHRKAPLQQFIAMTAGALSDPDGGY